MNTALACPRVVVLMATWNAVRFVAEQLDSIVAQRHVAVRVIISDDGSTDGTWPLLVRRCIGLPEVIVPLPHAASRFGNANRNFIRLICEADIGNADFVALSDHDDVWESDKLHRATDLMTRGGLDAFSSDVIAFWPDGRERLVRKSWPQRDFDYLFESAGPGCTFVLKRQAFEELRDWLVPRSGAAGAAKVHDWLIYAFARRRNWRWHIDEKPMLRYRQHAGNEIGANAGWRAVRSRWRSIRSGAFLRDVRTIADLVDDQTWVANALRRLSLLDRLMLVASASQLRRRPRDRLLLALFLCVMPARPPLTVGSNGLPGSTWAAEYDSAAQVDANPRPHQSDSESRQDTRANQGNLISPADAPTHQGMDGSNP